MLVAATFVLVWPGQLLQFFSESIYWACPSIFGCFLLLRFGERKVMVGIVDTFDKKGYDVGGLVSAVQ
jgi:hypothetical protein